MITQIAIELPAFNKGFHLITDFILSNVDALPEHGIFHLFIKHTSAGLTINENADPTVREDFETTFNNLIPESSDYVHTEEGPDDMPAHIKTALIGTSVSIPISNFNPHCS